MTERPGGRSDATSDATPDPNPTTADPAARPEQAGTSSSGDPAPAADDAADSTEQVGTVPQVISSTPWGTGGLQSPTDWAQQHATPSARPAEGETAFPARPNPFSVQPRRSQPPRPGGPVDPAWPSVPEGRAPVQDPYSSLRTDPPPTAPDPTGPARPAPSGEANQPASTGPETAPTTEEAQVSTVLQPRPTPTGPTSGAGPGEPSGQGEATSPQRAAAPDQPAASSSAPRHSHPSGDSASAPDQQAYPNQQTSSHPSAYSNPPAYAGQPGYQTPQPYQTPPPYQSPQPYQSSQPYQTPQQPYPNPQTYQSPHGSPPAQGYPQGDQVPAAYPDHPAAGAGSRQYAPPPAPPAPVAPVEPRSYSAGELIDQLNPNSSRRSRRGWRARFGLAPSPRELAETADEEMARTAFSRPVTIMVANPKGGVGKTPTTLLLAAAFGTARGGGVVAWDNNELRGTMPDRSFSPHRRTVRDLLDNDQRLSAPQSQFTDLAQFLNHQTAGKFHTLGSAQTSGHVISSDDFETIHAILSRYFQIILVDTGNNEASPNWLAAAAAADCLVVPTKWRKDSLIPAARMLETLQEFSRDLLDRTVVVATNGPADSQEEVKRNGSTWFNSSHSILEIPTDPHVAEGGVIDWSKLERRTRRAALSLAAQVAERIRPLAG